MKNTITGALIIAVAIIVGLAIFNQPTECPQGASSGPEHYNYETFYDGIRAYKFIEGGATTTLSAAATTSAITAAQACDSNYVEWTPVGETGDATLTLPSDTALRDESYCLNNDGDSVRFVFRNLADGELNTASTTYFVAGTDIVLLSGSSTVSGYTVATNTSVIVELQRVGASTTLGIITPLGDAD